MLPAWFLLYFACNDAVLFEYEEGRTRGGWIVTPCVRLELCCDLSLLCTPCTTITALCCCDPVTERHYCHADEVISFTGIKTKLHNRYKKSVSPDNKVL